MRVVFFGTPEFAVPSLRALLEEGFETAAVITQPDKPHGRSRSKLTPPPVKSVALDEGIPVLQPATPRDPEFLERIEELDPDIGVVVAYGHILHQDLLDLPERGMINVHASLLPALRGAAPIQHAILSGLEETGVSIMQMDKGMDTGPVILRIPTAIAPDETAGELSERLAELGALGLIEALSLLAAGDAVPEPQDHSAASFAPKVSRAMARIDWMKPADEISRVVRAFDPKPGAWTDLDGTTVKLFGPRAADAAHDVKPGTIVSVDPAFLVQTGNGVLQLIDVQPAGRQRMAAEAWARGQSDLLGRAFA